MPFVFYDIAAGAVYVSRFVLGAAAIALCVLLFRRSRNVGWLCLGVLFSEPFYLLALRIVQGRRIFPYVMSGGSTPGGAQELTIRFEIPILYILAVVGLFLLYRRAQRGTNESGGAGEDSN
jgi:hypothetical protein